MTMFHTVYKTLVTAVHQDMLCCFEACFEGALVSCANHKVHSHMGAGGCSVSSRGREVTGGGRGDAHHLACPHPPSCCRASSGADTKLASIQLSLLYNVK